MKTRLFLFAVAASLLLVSGAFADDRPGHVIAPPAWSDTPTAPDSINKRLEQAANRYELEAPIPRVVFYDIAYPGDDAELAAMDGYAVMLVTAVAQDRAELPPARIYVVVKGKQVTLTRVTGALSTLPADAHAAEVFGKHRWDALYLLPVYAVQDGNFAAVDFATHRKGFVFARFTTADPQALGYSHRVTRPPRTRQPPDAALDKLITREFPGFMKATQPKAEPDLPALPAP